MPRAKPLSGYPPIYAALFKVIHKRERPEVIIPCDSVGEALGVRAELYAWRRVAQAPGAATEAFLSGLDPKALNDVRVQVKEGDTNVRLYHKDDSIGAAKIANVLKGLGIELGKGDTVEVHTPDGVDFAAILATQRGTIEKVPLAPPEPEGQNPDRPVRMVRKPYEGV